MSSQSTLVFSKLIIIMVITLIIILNFYFYTFIFICLFMNRKIDKYNKLVKYSNKLIIYKYIYLSSRNNLGE